MTSHSAVSQTGRLAVRASWSTDGQVVLAYVTGCQSNRPSDRLGQTVSCNQASSQWVRVTVVQSFNRWGDSHTALCRFSCGCEACPPDWTAEAASQRDNGSTDRIRQKDKQWGENDPQPQLGCHIKCGQWQKFLSSVFRPLGDWVMIKFV